MSNDELIEQFARCEVWQDAEQWDLLGVEYFNRGYVLNAGVCFQRADACRLRVALGELSVAAETEVQLG